MAAAALLTGMDDDALPVGQAPFQALPRQFHVAARGKQGADALDAQFRCLLQGVVHALPAGDPLGENDVQGGFHVPFQGCADFHFGVTAAACQQDGRVFPALAIEEDEGGAGFEAQHPQQMTAGGLVQLQARAGLQGNGLVDAGCAHGGSIS